MEYLKLCDSDYRFMQVVWKNAPVNSGELVRLCQEELGWKKSTTYTTIKKLCQKGYIENTNATVTVRISRERVQAEESEYFVERTFGGSLPQFLAAFLGEKTISEKEAEKIKAMIDEHRNRE
ncbi:BlaI/MecI/CopY family transcriptional regulator [bacterium C-53]|nr:BlaI/MecI/CopY family transcriptional regulator [Lachnospiraceae bacterium]NBI03029.1 BlaI/MecI/CopY family transcriptional regulator [Lachnospiraceae bacterium]RKJ10641.1 BlaI/MecI/CopY family transcriptional regulator [bacterium C-53]